MNSVEKKPYDQEKAAFLVTISSTDSQTWAICITAWVRWQKRQNSWWVNWISLPRDREGWNFYFFSWREAPSRCLQDQTTCCSCINSNKIKLRELSDGYYFMSGGACPAPALTPLHSPSSAPQCSRADRASHMAPHHPPSWGKPLCPGTSGRATGRALPNRPGPAIAGHMFSFSWWAAWCSVVCLAVFQLSECWWNPVKINPDLGRVLATLMSASETKQSTSRNNPIVALSVAAAWLGRQAEAAGQRTALWQPRWALHWLQGSFLLLLFCYGDF